MIVFICAEQTWGNQGNGPRTIWEHFENNNIVGEGVGLTKDSIRACFFSTWGRVWVHHLSLSSGHGQNSNGWWLSCPTPWSIKTVNSVYPEFIMIHSFAIIYICQRVEKTWSAISGMAVPAVAWTQAQVGNLNSTSAVQDPHKGPFTPSVSVVSRIDSSINAWKEYTSF